MKKEYKGFELFNSIMKFRNNNKRGQAAVEFLMTYGWMLLIVLIVGALVFSFVDWGLLPNSLNFDNSFRADASQLNIDTTTNEILFPLEYMGTSGRIEIDITQVRFETNFGENCNASSIRDFSNSRNVSSSKPENFTTGREDGFVITFKCPPGVIVEGVSIEGAIILPYMDVRTKIKQTATGTLRARVN